MTTNTMTVKYPKVCVKLTGSDGNAFAILGAVTKAMREAGLDKDERDAFIAEATAGDYDHLLAAAMNWVDVR